MKKSPKSAIFLLTLLAVMAAMVIGTTANAFEPADIYDPAVDGIASYYYHIDREKGFITGIAPGTTAEALLKVCLPGNAVVSQETLATGATIQITVPTADEAVPASNEAEPDTEVTEPDTEVTEPDTEVTEPDTEVTEPDTEVTEPDTEVTEPDTEVTEPDTEVTEPDTEVTEPDTEVTEPETEVTEPDTEVTEPETEVTEPDGGDANTYTLTVIVTGDLNGDGKVSITDMLMVKSSVLGEALSDTATAAADINYDSKVTITDFLQVKAALLGLSSITAGRPADTDEAQLLILMTPNTSQSWVIADAVSFVSYDPTVATVDADGTIRTLEKEGSTFVYALDTEGQILAKAMVTVLNDGLTVSFPTNTYRMQIQQTATLTPVFNHPVRPAVSWTSSDETIVSVSADGTLTSHAMGFAVLTATLENGSSAQITVTVAPPITALEIERELYKVKPGNTKALSLLMTPADSGEEIIWTTGDASIATVSSDGIVTGVAYGTTTITATGKYSGLSATCKVKVCNVKQVAITFDDGPSNQTKQLLDFLKENDIRVTFFLVGNRVRSYASIVKREAAEGHEIGYHSYSHQIQPSLTSSQIAGDFNKSNKELIALTGQGYTLWRTPGGSYNSRVLSCVPLPHILWSVDTLDWQTRNATAVYNQIINNAKDGSIILMHDLYSTTVSGAIQAMLEMQEGDYEFLTVTELLSRDGTPPENGKTYFSGN